MTKKTIELSAWLAFSLASGGPAPVATRSYPLDCLPDRVSSASVPASAFGATLLPGIVLGPPGDSSATDGSFSVVSLGLAGQVTVAFDEVVIEDGPGPDFIVFENPFFRLPLPAGPGDPFRIFAEPGRVEVSADGVSWHAFPFDAAALTDATGVGDIDQDLYPRLVGLAGITPSFTGNWTAPDEPLGWDAGGTAGVSGAGGDAFDLADVGLAEARRVRITDAASQNGFGGSTAGFDLDAVIALHARPVAPADADADADGLSDLEELRLYDTDPAEADSDLDGIDDGREVAGCRDPLASTAAASWRGEPRLVALGGACTELRWSFTGTGVTYDLVRGDLDALGATAIAVDLGPVTCIVNDSGTLRFSCDAELPAPGRGFFYLVRSASSGWGRGSSLDERVAGGGCP